MNQVSGILWTALLAGAMASTSTTADGTVTWSTGYPKQGAGAGQMLVKGSATASTGFTLATSGTVKYFPQGGGVPLTATVTINADGTFGETTISGLTSGVTYHVWVEVVENNATDQQTLACDPATVTAP